MPHPITDMFVSLQEPQAIRVANMAERVAVWVQDSIWVWATFCFSAPIRLGLSFSQLGLFSSLSCWFRWTSLPFSIVKLFYVYQSASIDSQKMADAHASPQYLAHMYYLQEEQRTKTYNSFTCVNSYYKGREGGIGSSFKTVRYYNDKARQVRDEMLAKMA